MDKISTEFTVDSNPPDELYLQMCQRAVLGDPAIKSITVMSNWFYDW